MIRSIKRVKKFIIPISSGKLTRLSISMQIWIGNTINHSGRDKIIMINSNNIYENISQSF